MDSRQRLLLQIGFGLVLLTCAVFGRVAWLDFTEYDDKLYVVDSTLVQGGLSWRGIGESFTTFRASNWHPLTWLSLIADRQFFGPGPAGFHLTNLALHLANVLLLFVALERMSEAVWRSGLVAALFAVHPLHVESVAWVAERKDVLSTVFWMLALVAYNYYVRRPGWGRYALVLGAFALGLMAKPMLVTLPCVLLLLDVWPLQRIDGQPGALTVTGGIQAAVPPSRKTRSPSKKRAGKASESRQATPGNSCGSQSWRWLLLEKLPLFVLAAASCVVTLRAQQVAIAPIAKFTFTARLANSVMAYMGYLMQTVWPTHLTCFYPYTPARWNSAGPIFAAIVLVGITLAVCYWRRFPWLGVGWFWYLGTLVPVIGLVQVGAQARADRYSYIPLIGIFLMGAWSIPSRWWPRHRRLIVATSVITLGLLACQSWRQVGYWQDTTTLFEHALAVTDRNWVAHINLGLAAQSRKKLAVAEAHYREALNIAPSSAQAHTLLADLLERRGDLAGAREHGLEAIRNNPHIPEAHGIVGLTFAKQGEFDKAVSCFRAAVRLLPENAEFHYNLALALADAGEAAAAIDEFRAVIQLRPDHAKAHNELGALLVRQGEPGEAIREFRESLRLDPRNPQARRNLDEQLQARPSSSQ